MSRKITITATDENFTILDRAEVYLTDNPLSIELVPRRVGEVITNSMGELNVGDGKS